MKKRYWALLALIFLVWLDWYIRAPDAQSRELTAVIRSQGSPQLQQYPYPFKVFRVEPDGTAVMGTPRSFEMPAAKFLQAAFPELNTRDNNDPAFVAAQQQLGKVQDEARGIILKQPGIKAVRWELDRDWLREQGIAQPGNP